MWLLLLCHVAEVPRELQVDARVAPVLLVAIEGGALGEVLPLAGVEHVAPVQGHGECLVEESLANAQVERTVGIAVALGDDRARAVVARGLYGDAVGQDDRGQQTGIPGEVLVALARHELVLNVGLEAVQLVVVGVDRGGQVQDAPQLVLHDELGTGALALRHVEVGHIHELLGLALIADALYHVGRGPVVGA